MNYACTWWDTTSSSTSIAWFGADKNPGYNRTGLRPGAADPSFFGGAAVAAAVSPISGAWDIDIKEEPQDAPLESRGPRGLEPYIYLYIYHDWQILKATISSLYSKSYWKQGDEFQVVTLQAVMGNDEGRHHPPRVWFKLARPWRWAH